MFVISHRNRNICSSLYEVASDGRQEDKKMKREGEGEEKKCLCFTRNNAVAVLPIQMKKK